MRWRHGAKGREVTLRFIAEPTDVNFGGKVHGGTVMKWIDQAGYACAADPKEILHAQTTHCIIVFVAVDGQERPVKVERWEP